MSNLSNLNVGDSIAIYRFSYLIAVKKITRITKTFVEASGHKFNINTGFGYPSERHNPSSAAPATQQHRDEIIHKKTARKLNDFNFEDLSLSALKQIESIIDNKAVNDE